MEDLEESEVVLPATDPPQWAEEIYRLCHEEAIKSGEVYPPSDDSFLMLEALETDSKQYPAPDICLEVGPGSGICTMGALFLWPLACCIAAEKNPIACEVTQKLNPRALVVQTSFAEALRLGGTVDVGFFNPPYVVTPPEEMEGLGISISWAGGERGRVVLDAFLHWIPVLLSTRGRWYICGIRENDLDELRKRVSDLGLLSEVVCERTCGIEDLWVLKITAMS